MKIDVLYELESIKIADNWMSDKMKLIMYKNAEMKSP